MRILLFSASSSTVCETYKNMLKENDINFDSIDL